MPKTFFIKGTSGHIKNMGLKQFFNHKVWDFATTFRVPKLFWTFEKGAPDVHLARNLKRPLAEHSRYDAAMTHPNDERCITSKDHLDRHL